MPAKAFIDPAGIYLTQSGYIQNPALAAIPNNKTMVAVPQIEQMIVRFTIAPVVTPTQSQHNLLPSQTDMSTARNMVFNTFSSIYQERGSSAARPTEGQLYPTGL